MAEDMESTKPKRPFVTVYFEDEEQLEKIRAASGGNMSQYCRDRILYNEGYADDRQRIAARLMQLANGLQGDLDGIGDLVRAHYALRTALKESSGHGGDARLWSLVDEIDAANSKLLQRSEESSPALTALTRAIHEFALACADHELAQKRAVTIQQRHRSKP